MSTSAAAAPPRLLSFRDVPRGDVIRRVWYAQLVSLFGDFLALFAVIAVVTFRMHGSPSQLTSVQITYMLPLVVLGPAAGALVAAFGPASCYALDVLSFLVSASLIGSVTIRQPSEAHGQQASGNRIREIARDLGQGSRFIAGHAAVLFVVLAMAAGLFMIGCFGVLADRFGIRMVFFLCAAIAGSLAAGGKLLLRARSG